MKLEKFSWKIVGTRPLMQSNPITIERTQVPEGMGTRKKKKATLGARDEAAKQLYITADGNFYHPGACFWRALEDAAPGKTFGSEAATTTIARGVDLPQPEFILLDPDTIKSANSGKPLTDTDWVVDMRPAVNHNCRPPVTVIACRPKWKHWGGVITMEVDIEMFATLQPLTDLLNVAGWMGIGVGRTRKNGNVWGSLGMGKFIAEFLG